MPGRSLEDNRPASRRAAYLHPLPRLVKCPLQLFLPVGATPDYERSMFRSTFATRQACHRVELFRTLRPTCEGRDFYPSSELPVKHFGDFLSPSLLAGANLLPPTGPSAARLPRCLRGARLLPPHQLPVKHSGEFTSPLLLAGASFVAPYGSLQPPRPLHSAALRCEGAFSSPPPGFRQEVARDSLPRLRAPSLPARRVLAPLPPSCQAPLLNFSTTAPDHWETATRLP